MGFALWIEDDVRWAEGTHEYRPMGSAVIARGSLFGARDFRPDRQAPSKMAASYVGLFASIGDLNQHLESLPEPGENGPRSGNRSQSRRKRFLHCPSRSI